MRDDELAAWRRIEAERRADRVGSWLLGAVCAVAVVLWLLFSEGPW